MFKTYIATWVKFKLFLTFNVCFEIVVGSCTVKSPYRQCQYLIALWSSYVWKAVSLESSRFNHPCLINIM